MEFQDIKQFQKAHVWKDSQLVGVLERTPDGSYFEYNPDYFANTQQPPLSFQISKGQQRTLSAGVNLHPFFAGLLPEGLRLHALVETMKTSADDLFSLLLASGAETIGDVSITLGQGSPSSFQAQIDISNLAQEDFGKCLKQSLSYGSTISKNSEASIPGVQEKISAAMISLPVKSKKKKESYILKLNPPDKPQLVQNENFFMHMAKACGLDVASVELVFDQKKEPGLLVKRFDRWWNKEKRESVKIHQEDACQFLNFYPADKYRLSLREIADGIWDLCDTPILEIAKLIRQVAFSYLIGNGDLHAKNISLMVDPQTHQVKLSPAYDLLSTLPYGDTNMALKMLGRDNHLKRAHFIEFGSKYQINPKAVDSILDEISDNAADWIKRCDEIGLPEKKIIFLKKMMQERREEWKD